jgi:hypothetical protein
MLVDSTHSSPCAPALNNHRIHTTLHGLRHHTLAGGPDLVFRELPLKIYRPPHHPRSNEEGEYRADYPLHDEPNLTWKPSWTVLRRNFRSNNLLVRHRISTMLVKISLCYD